MTCKHCGKRIRFSGTPGAAGIWRTECGGIATCYSSPDLHHAP